MSTRDAYQLAARQYRAESRRLIKGEPGANPWPFLSIARRLANHWDACARPAYGRLVEFQIRETVGPLAGRRVLAGPTRSGRLFFRRLP